MPGTSTVQNKADRLIGALGADCVRIGDAIDDRYRGDWSTTVGGTPAIQILPTTTADVATALRLCHEMRQPVVPQGGMTGVVGGATPVDGAVLLSMDRMHGIEQLDATAATMTVRAGTPLQTIQEAAERAGFLFSLDLGARGSCQIGGNIATNAGGNRVLRYGMTRALVLGLEAVLADGTVLPMLNTMTKNNTGMDVKQLFVGTEGTMGVITRTVLRLHPGIAGANTALVALPDFRSATHLLNHAQRALSGRVSAFELMWDDYYRRAVELGGARPPLAPGQPLYALIDMQGPAPDAEAERFEAVLEEALTQGWASDAAVAASQSDANDFWALRDCIADLLSQLAPTINFDVSVPIATIDTCVERMRAVMDSRFPDLVHMYFGHIGDSNIHCVVGPIPPDGDTEHAIEQACYDIVRDLSGSVSAEHGIGLHKRPWLEYSRTAEEIELMRTLKRTVDPHGIMNPGKVLTP